MSEQLLQHVLEEIKGLKVDMAEMSKAVIALAKVEVKHDALDRRMNIMEQRQNSLSEKIDKLTELVTKNSTKTDGQEWFTRLVNGAVLTGMISLALYFLR